MKILELYSSNYLIGMWVKEVRQNVMTVNFLCSQYAWKVGQNFKIGRYMDSPVEAQSFFNLLSPEGINKLYGLLNVKLVELLKSSNNMITGWFRRVRTSIGEKAWKVN